MTGKSFRESLGAIGSILPFGRPSGAVVHSPDQRTKEQVDPIAETESTLDGPQTPSNRRILVSGEHNDPHIFEPYIGLIPHPSSRKR